MAHVKPFSSTWSAKGFSARVVYQTRHTAALIGTKMWHKHCSGVCHDTSHTRGLVWPLGTTLGPLVAPGCHRGTEIVTCQKLL